MKKNYIREILLEYERKRDKAQKELEYRKLQVYDIVPEIKKIDDEIASTGIKISRAVLNNPDNYEKEIELIQNHIEKLKQKKAILLTENNIPLSFLEINYECNKCKDTGYLENSKKCDCFKQQLIEMAYSMSNISKVIEKENFQTFNLELFSNKEFENEELTPRENMQNILTTCEGFVINFEKINNENLLLYGTTGLGKTFMCNCITKALLDKGKIVVYQTAFKILQILEEYQFSKNKSPEIKESYKLLFDCDLLIIDDLGTEFTNTFTNVEIFNILNSRLISNKKTIISTNNEPVKLVKKYSDRIVSRIFGSFTILRFFGPDLRWEVKSKNSG